MTELTVIWVASSFLAAAICLSLAISLYRQAERSFEINNLIVVTLLFVLRAVLSGVQGLTYGIPASPDDRAHYVFTNGAYLLHESRSKTMAPDSTRIRHRLRETRASD